MTLHRSLALRIFLFSWLAYTVHWAPFLIRELFPAVTLARSGSLDVSEYLGWINDIFAGPRGGAYINNNPSASIAGAIPLAVAQPALDAVARWNEAHPQWKSLDSLDSSSVRKVVEARRELYFVLASLLTVAGLAAPFLRGRHAVPAREMWLILSHFVMAVLFCAANHYSWLQHTTGCRYLVIVVPGMLLLSLEVLCSLPRWLATAVVGFSVVLNWAAAMTYRPPWQALALILKTGPQLPWANRVAELNLASVPVAVPWLVELALLLMIPTVAGPRRREAVLAGTGAP